MRRVPLPCALDDRLDAVPRRPPEHGSGAPKVRVYRDRVTGPTTELLDRDLPTAHPARDVDHLEHRRALAGSEVDHRRVPAALEMIDRADVRVGEIDHVHVVADGR